MIKKRNKFIRKEKMEQKGYLDKNEIMKRAYAAQKDNKIASAASIVAVTMLLAPHIVVTERGRDKIYYKADFLDKVIGVANETHEK